MSEIQQDMASQGCGSDHSGSRDAASVGATAPLTKYLHGKVPVRIVGSDYLVFLVERIDGKPMDDHGRARDWIAKGAIYDAPLAFNEFEPTCSECGGIGRRVTGREIYPHRPDLHAKHFYRCHCGAYVGCHPGTVKALGTPAGPETRRARSAAHAAFDPIWKRGNMRRGDAYKALAAQLGIAPGACHISWFDAALCARVVKAVPDLAIARATGGEA